MELKKVTDIVEIFTGEDSKEKARDFELLLENGNKLTKSLKLKIKEVSRTLLSNLTSTISDLNNLETNFQLRFDD